HLDQAFPLLWKQMELTLPSGELNPRNQHTVTLYAKGLTCKADTLGSGGYVYLAVYPPPETKKSTTGITFCSGLVLSPRHFSIFHLCISGKPSV
ncbi:type IV toxin-antitoxin system YeeU family antitoxin, partial [Escherichia coli]|nr:type IV toxin-antitoxin system YeeU family antitoxin [Escherichia coli]